MRIPPQAKDIESAVIGSILVDGKAINKIKSILKPEMFYQQNFGDLFRVMLEMNEAQKPIDLLTVKENTDIKASELVGFTANIGSAAHITEHAAIIYDKWLAREMIKTGTELVERSYNDDIVEVIKSARSEVEKRLLGVLGLNSFGISIREAGDKSIEEYFKREKMISEGKRSGTPTAFDGLDKFTGGWQKEQLIILAARPAMGKTSIAMNFLMSAATYGKSVAMYSLEMSAVKLTDKIICSIADVSLTDYKKGKLMDLDKKKVEDSLGTFESWKVNFNDNLLTDIDKIFASAQAIKSRQGLDLIIIDYLQLMRGEGQNREREVAENSRKAKMMAVELECPVILLSQLNRGLEMRADKRPMLSDLRESGAIEQDADLVLFIHRESVYDDSAPDDQGEIILAKHREGATGVVRFKHNESLTRFEDFTDNLPF